MIKLFEQFLADADAHEFYITGVAGTGKTTSLAEIIKYCMSKQLTTVTCAYTHKAVKVLYNKIPYKGEKNVICTLHSYLKKRPTVNDQATQVAHVDGNSQIGIPYIVNVLLIDEFSMMGEKDYLSISELQYDEDGNIITKVVYIGDPNQLPPVKDAQTIYPRGAYQHHLTKIHRQKDDNPLIDTLLELNDYINGKPVKGLTEHSKFIRKQNIVDLYKQCKTSKILLAYTNQQVENLNGEVQGRYNPEIGDLVFSPTVRELYNIEAMEQSADNIVTIRGEILELESKYKTLETLHTIEDIKFFTLIDNEQRISQRAVVFGHSSYLCKQQDLANEAVKINKKIEKQFNENPKSWAQTNWSHPLAKERSKAWKRYLAFKDCVLCVDFSHAMTVHKSQGSTYENVFLDTEDMSKCANSNYELYLKLLYVAISRASDTVYTN